MASEYARAPGVCMHDLKEDGVDLWITSFAEETTGFCDLGLQAEVLCEHFSAQVVLVLDPDTVDKIGIYLPSHA